MIVLYFFLAVMIFFVSETILTAISLTIFTIIGAAIFKTKTPFTFQIQFFGTYCGNNGSYILTALASKKWFDVSLNPWIMIPSFAIVWFFTNKIKENNQPVAQQLGMLTGLITAVLL